MKSNFVIKIIQVNILVFFMWMFLDIQFMSENFLVSPAHVLSGRPWTLLTSVFSHNLAFHIFINMFVLFSFGPPVESILGTRSFIIFYLLAGICGSLGHCLSSFYLMDNPYLAALGASGAVSAVLVLFSLMNPRHLIYFFGIIPMPALVAALLFIGLDVWGLVTQVRGSTIPIGHGAHLGGALVGVIYFIMRFNLRRKSTRHAWQY